MNMIKYNKKMNSFLKVKIKIKNKCYKFKKNQI